MANGASPKTMLQCNRFNCQALMFSTPVNCDRLKNKRVEEPGGGGAGVEGTRYWYYRYRGALFVVSNVKVCRIPVGHLQ